jgi:hypothetical protein
MKIFINWITQFTILLAIYGHAYGGELNGLWEEFDDDTGKITALIRIEQQPDNTYEGKIEKLFIDNQKTTRMLLCEKCTGKLHNQPVLGLAILVGMKRQGDRSFAGGKVIDPDDGKVYSCEIQLAEDGNSLQISGYIGLNWIGQSEIWRRLK